MKKQQVKIINAPNDTDDLEKVLNEYGQEGWKFSGIVASQFGMKIMLVRELDEEATFDAAAEKTAELEKKFKI